jgi:hypothetical protein
MPLGRFMRQWLRRSVGYLAIFAIVLHTILLAAVAPIAAANSVDPFSVICHSTPADAAADSQTGVPDGAPSGPCDHCKLCSAVAAPTAPTTLLDSDLAPSRLVEVLYPSSMAPAGGIATTPKLARGPPPFA